MILKVCVISGHVFSHEVSGNDPNAFKYDINNTNFPRFKVMDVYGNETAYNWDQITFINLGMQGKETKTEMRL